MHLVGILFFQPLHSLFFSFHFFLFAFHALQVFYIRVIRISLFYCRAILLTQAKLYTYICITNTSFIISYVHGTRFSFRLALISCNAMRVCGRACVWCVGAWVWLVRVFVWGVCVCVLCIGLCVWCVCVCLFARVRACDMCVCVCFNKSHTTIYI